MVSASLTWLRQRAGMVRLVVVALALACQISAGAAVPAQDAAEAQAKLVSDVAVFCQSGARPGKHDGAPAHRQVPDHALCRALSVHGHAVAVLDRAPLLRLPSMARTGQTRLPAARAPPAREIAAFDARGPPHLA
jgi:hypothetical protein